MFDPHPACADVAILNRETADVQVVPRRKKVAIIGFATNTLHMVPWYDPEWELWSMNQGHMHCYRRTDRHFEMHLPESTPDVRDPMYLPWLQACPIPIYMVQTYDEYPTSVRYPIEEALHLTKGRDYFTSSVAFMLALAEMYDFQEVGLFGINLAIGDEWAYERPCAEYWLGRLEARGVKLNIPKASSLLKQYLRYGYHVDARPNQNLRALANNRIATYRAEAEQLAGQLHQKIGHMREAESMLQILEGVEHGADVVLIPDTAARPIDPTKPAT